MVRQAEELARAWREFGDQLSDSSLDSTARDKLLARYNLRGMPNSPFLQELQAFYNGLAQATGADPKWIQSVRGATDSVFDGRETVRMTADDIVKDLRRDPAFLSTENGEAAVRNFQDVAATLTREAASLKALSFRLKAQAAKEQNAQSKD